MWPFMINYNGLSVNMYCTCSWHVRRREVCGIEGERVASPRVCFPEAIRSLIIAVKSTAKQLSKGKQRQGRGGGGGEGEGEGVKSYREMEERGVVLRPWTKARTFKDRFQEKQGASRVSAESSLDSRLPLK